MNRPDRRYQILQALVIPVSGFAMLLIIDLILHPFEQDFQYQPFWSRWLYGFMFALINIVIGVLCMRRVPNDVIGPLLILYGSGLTAQGLRSNFDPLLTVIILFTGGSLGWGGFFYIVLLFPSGHPHPRWVRW